MNRKTLWLCLGVVYAYGMFKTIADAFDDGFELGHQRSPSYLQGWDDGELYARRHPSVPVEKTEPGE